ncbi:hypothetical protein NDU88_011161 [Pleurodeles waltl]|uniref:Uncharacterized protein n=1 Tax=Pleurodeles waltl TaxID=8319 RepID=A0AAV7S5C0_PLEWA|nr:hypothetical protein NDU88_011161 [Pleurodeles waltl]
MLPLGSAQRPSGGSVVLVEAHRVSERQSDMQICAAERFLELNGTEGVSGASHLTRAVSELLRVWHAEGAPPPVGARSPGSEDTASGAGGVAGRRPTRSRVRSPAALVPLGMTASAGSGRVREVRAGSSLPPRVRAGSGAEWWRCLARSSAHSRRQVLCRATLANALQ